MKIIQGDLIRLAVDGEFDVIVHGCNCYCTMGAGIAKGIKARFPEAFRADRKTEKGSAAKLGTFSHAVCANGSGGEVIVVNAYTQHHWRGKKPLADYDAIRKCFRAIRKQFGGKRIGYPLIGAGLAGGDWEIIGRIIDEELNGEDHTLVEFRP